MAKGWLLMVGAPQGWKEPCSRARMLIRYRDKDSIETERTIRPKYIEGFDVAGRGRTLTHIVAYCEMQRGPRNFRLDGIVMAADAETGELIGDLRGYLLPSALGQPAAEKPLKPRLPPPFVTTQPAQPKAPVRSASSYISASIAIIAVACGLMYFYQMEATNVASTATPAVNESPPRPPVRYEAPAQSPSAVAPTQPAGSSEFENRMRLLGRTVGFAGACDSWPKGMGATVTKNIQERISELPPLYSSGGLRSLQTGLDDAADYLRRNGMIGCVRSTDANAKMAEDYAMGRRDLLPPDATGANPAVSDWINGFAGNLQQMGRDDYVLSQCQPLAQTTGTDLIWRFGDAKKTLPPADARYAGDLDDRGREQGKRDLASDRQKACASITPEVRQHLLDLARGSRPFGSPR